MQKRSYELDPAARKARRLSTAIGPDCDVLVELLEKFARSLCNLELADEVPCDKRIK